ncbi:MFS transporter [Chlamydiifrater phoenicopteri]|uniref:MFS transporter n=1 Tax=Chlamydiifrater phoenicopteri TaxID=2681469 RepID=UPI001BCD69FD|nr:hypothetical protein [Chlamydiifrater phoenicopteri]
MQRAIRLLLNLDFGGEFRTGLFLCLGLVWGIGCYGTLTLSEGLFLENVGASKLPSIYFFSSVFLCVCSALFLYNMTKKRVSSTMLFVLSVAGMTVSNIVMLGFFLFKSPAELRTAFFVYRTLSWSLTVLSYTTFWGFTDQFFDIQDGKKYFCIFNAIIFLGDALGSGSISWFINHLGVSGILISFIICLICVFPIVIYISKSLNELSDDHHHYLETEYFPNFWQSVKICFKDKFTFYLLAFYFLMQLLAVTTEFNYMKTFSRVFSSSDSEYKLVAFLGSCSLWISLGNMIFALFAYSRIVRRIGVSNIIMIAPFCFLKFFILFLFYDSLGIAVLGMIAREGVTYALDDNNLQLLIYGVPNRVRNQLRIAIESFLEPVGMLFCSFLCFLLDAQVKFSLLIASIATVVGFTLRSEYSKAIFINLSSHVILWGKTLKDWLKTVSSREKRQIERQFLINLKHSSEKNRMFAFQNILDMGNRNLLPRLLANMNKFSLPNKIRALDMLKNSAWARDSLTIEFLRRWNNTIPHPAIKAAIHLYFAEQSLLSPQMVLPDLREDNRSDKLLAAILTVRRFYREGEHRLLADSLLEKLLKSSDENALLLGLTVLEFEKNPGNLATIFEYTDQSCMEVRLKVCRAIKASIRPHQKEYFKTLIKMLKDCSHPEGVVDLMHAIGVILDSSTVREFLLTATNLKAKARRHAELIIANLSEDTTEKLLEIFTDNTMHNRTRILCARILSKTSPDSLKENAYHIIKTKIQKACFYAYHKEILRQAYPKYDLSLLQHTLQSNYDSEVNFILEVLGFIGGAERSDILTRALTGKNKKTRAQALESLEKHCDNGLFSLIEPLTIPDGERFFGKKFLKMGGSPLSLKELLHHMESSPSRLNKLTARQLKRELSVIDPSYNPSTWQQTEHSEDAMVIKESFFPI